MLEANEDEELWLEGSRAWNVLKHFGIPAGVLAEEKNDGECATIDIHSDPSFGPLLRLTRPGKPPVIRITPLTDRDAREMLEAAGLTGERELEELLGRMSQMIEELPWLSAMTARLDLNRGADGPTSTAVRADVTMELRP